MYTLWDMLYTWSLHHCPGLLTDEQLFQKLHDFLHRILQEQHRKNVRATIKKVDAERTRMMRMMKPSAS